MGLLVKKFYLIMLTRKIVLKPSSVRRVFLFSYCFCLLPLLIFLTLSNKAFIIEWEIISVRTTFLRFPIILDFVGISFSFIVCFISGCVIIFSSSYIREDKFLSRFVWLVILFVLSINILIFVPRLISLLLGWDGLGIVSFALIIYYQNIKSFRAGMLTILINRIGDVALLTGVGLCILQGHWNILLIDDYRFLRGLRICILLAAITKRAQVPFSRWLPAAMAAPTPVSALVHSSTLVTAGVFLMIRFFPFISCWKYFRFFLIFVSVITLFIAGIRANYEYDIKKIIALSTLSQLGVMIISLALNLPFLALFHLYTHAMFKAILFICAGIIIHNNKNAQDLRLLGRLWKDIPLTVRCLNIANLALCGAPFLRGFYSKDIILEISLFRPCRIAILIFIFLGTAITSAYTVRLTLFSIWGPSNYLSLHQIYDEDERSTFPIILLRRVTVFGGVFLQYNVLDFNVSLFLPLYLKILGLSVIIIGGLISYTISRRRLIMKEEQRKKFSFLSLIWFLTPISTLPIRFLSMKGRINFIKVLDQGWLEILGGSGRFFCLIKLAQINQVFQKRIINAFIRIIMFFIFLFICLK